MKNAILIFTLLTMLPGCYSYYGMQQKSDQFAVESLFSRSNTDVMVSYRSYQDLVRYNLEDSAIYMWSTSTFITKYNSLPKSGRIKIKLDNSLIDYANPANFTIIVRLADETEIFRDHGDKQLPSPNSNRWYSYFNVSLHREYEGDLYVYVVNDISLQRYDFIIRRF